MSSTLGGRRAEYAQATRAAILAAARQLFVERGYFATRVEDIAREARVAAPTVYAAGGGKSGLLRAMVEEGVRAEESKRPRPDIAAQSSPEELIRRIVEATSRVFEDWWPLMRQVTQAAAQDAGVRQSLDLAHASLREGLELVATRLAELDALPAGMSAADATGLLWYYLGNSSYATLTGDLGWPMSRAASWLYERLTAVLLKDEAAR